MCQYGFLWTLDGLKTKESEFCEDWEGHYYVTFIDDATRKVWIYFLRQKSDVFQTFKKWKCLVENETSKN